MTVADAIFGVIGLLLAGRGVSDAQPIGVDVGGWPVTGDPQYSDAVRAFAVAIARAEGFYSPNPNVIPRLAHNPGDLKLPPSLSPLGYLNGHTIFATDDEGWAALYRQLQLIVDGRSQVYTLSMTIADMGVKYAEASATWIANVSAALGVSPSTPLAQVLR